MTTPARPRPSVQQRRLANTLRTLRTERGLSRTQVAELTGIQPASLYCIETARRRPQARTLDALLTLYRVSDHQRRVLARLRTEATATTWLNAYTDILDDTTYSTIELQNHAHTLHTYSSLCVPDLLQTPAYAHAVTLTRLAGTDQDTAERHIALHTARQAALIRRHQPLHLHAVCDEAALHRLVGGPDVMTEQLRHLAEAAALPNVTLRIIPFTAGAYPTTPPSFTLIHLTDDTTTVHVQDPEVPGRGVVGLRDEDAQ